MNTKPFGFAVIGTKGDYLGGDDAYVVWSADKRILKYWDGLVPNAAPYRFDTLYTKDVVVQLLSKLKRGDCWCEVAVGNPMCSDHSETCKEIMEFIK